MYNLLKNSLNEEASMERVLTYNMTRVTGVTPGIAMGLDGSAGMTATIHTTDEGRISKIETIMGFVRFLKRLTLNKSDIDLSLSKKSSIIPLDIVEFYTNVLLEEFRELSHIDKSDPFKVNLKRIIVLSKKIGLDPLNRKNTDSEGPVDFREIKTFLRKFGLGSFRISIEKAGYTPRTIRELIPLSIKLGEATIRALNMAPTTFGDAKRLIKKSDNSPKEKRMLKKNFYNYLWVNATACNQTMEILTSNNRILRLVLGAPER